MTCLTGRLHVVDPDGIHARPATVIARLVQECNCEATFSYAGNEADGASVLDLLSLAVPGNVEVRVHLDGVRSAELLERLHDVFADGFKLR